MPPAKMRLKALSMTSRRTDFGMKPYSALFGTLKVADVVEVAVDARVPAAMPTVGSEQRG